VVEPESLKGRVSLDKLLSLLVVVPTRFHILFLSVFFLSLLVNLVTQLAQHLVNTVLEGDAAFFGLYLDRVGHLGTNILLLLLESFKGVNLEALGLDINDSVGLHLLARLAMLA
jgi:hypothetical protein